MIQLNITVLVFIIVSRSQKRTGYARLGAHWPLVEYNRVASYGQEREYGFRRAS